MSLLEIPHIYRIIETDNGFFIEKRVRVIHWFWEVWTSPRYEWIAVDTYGYSLRPVGNIPTAPAARFDSLEKAREQIRKWERPTYKIHEP